MKNRLEVIISTMNLNNQKDFENLIKNSNLICNTLTINQVKNNKNNIKNFKNNRILSYEEKGLSKSRNRALENSIGDILLIADDDVKYVDNLDKIILKEFSSHPDYDFIAFKVINTNKNIKEGNVSWLNSFKLCSVQIAFRKKSIIDNNMLFDERFGAGSELFTHGEENIFLSDSIKKGLKVLYIDEVIGELLPSESSWFKGFNEKFFETKGALFYRLSKKIYLFLCLQFLIRKYKLYKKDISIFNAYKNMRKGKNKLKEIINEEN